MKASEFITEYGVGKITAQNATADVKPGDEFKNVKKLRLEHIRKQGDKYVVLSKDGKRKFGTYTSKAKAEKRLRQIEMFKHMGK